MQARFCSCNTELCNLNLYNYSDYSRVKRHRTDSRQNFLFPFQPQSEGELVGGGGGELETRGVNCYSCGSLFSRDVPHCPQFSRQNLTQRQSCQRGEVCLLYQWRKPGGGELGSYRECFPSNIILGHPDDPIIPQPRCRLAKTQRDPRSSIRACLCTTDHCNTEEEAELEQERRPKLTRLISDSSVECERLAVSRAEYADCDGEYLLSQYVVLWAVTRQESPPYRDLDKDQLDKDSERERFFLFNG